jgi:hypothetical protein
MMHVLQIYYHHCLHQEAPNRRQLGVPNTAGLYSINNFALSLKPVIHRVAVAFPSAQKEVIGAKTDFVFYDRFYQPVLHNYWGVHRGHLSSAAYVRSNFKNRTIRQSPQLFDPQDLSRK